MQAVDETVQWGNQLGCSWYVSTGSARKKVAEREQEEVVAGVASAADSIIDAEVRGQALRVIAQLQGALVSFNLSRLPPLTYVASEDGSFSIEWRLPQRRLAFTLDPDPLESAWHIVALHGDCPTLYGSLPSIRQMRVILAMFLDQE